MIERIQKILSARGLCSRRQAEKWILEGRVSCNGETCTLGQTADPDRDEILVDGKPLPKQEAYVYIMLNKPKGYVTTLSDEKGRKNAAQLVADCGARVYPVGRLDMDSEGLLLFTNDGDFANRLMHPKHKIDKVYLATVKGYAEDSIRRLQQPMSLDGHRLQTPSVKCVEAGENGSAQLLITIHEGRNRQVRRMCAIAGMQVKKLVRIAEGPLELGALREGFWRYLSEQERNMFADL